MDVRTPVVTMLAAVALGAGGCASRVPAARFAPPEAIPHYAAARAAATPRRETWVESSRPGEPPMRLRVVEWGTPGHGRVVVCIHGMLMDADDWAAVGGDLVRDHDVVAVDLPGAGCSDAPAAACLGPGAYSVEDAGRRILRVLDAYLADRADRPVTLVGESLGAVVALRAMSSLGAGEGSRTRGRVDRLVAQAPTDVVVGTPNPGVRTVVAAGDVEVALGAWLGILRLGAEAFTARNTDDSTPVPIGEPRRIASVLADPPRRRAAQRMVRSVAPFDDDGRPLWEEIETVDRVYDSVEVPALLLWGARDELAPVTMGHRIRDRLPRARLEIVPRTKHFLGSWERPRVFAARIRAFEQPGAPDGPAVRTLEISDER